MSGALSGTIIYHVVSPVHVRNAQLLASELKGWSLRIAYEQEFPWLSSTNMNSLFFESIALDLSEIPAALWSGEVQGVVFSSAQPRQVPVSLLRAGLERGLPTIAIEESNQIALNQGTVNNYVLPVDHVLVASEYERQGMVAAGFPERRFTVTGWPFYQGRVGAVTPIQRRTRKLTLGLDPERPVASLTLTGLYDSGESPAVRRRQLSLAAQGLPPEYQLVIKPHPIERREVLQPFVDECAPRATVIEGMVRVDELLEATDVLLNRGASQVCIEALFQEIPVIVLGTGIQTPFHGLAQGLIIEQPEEMREALERLAREPDPMMLYTEFRQSHVPLSPREAREATCRRIAEICQHGERDPVRGRQWFDLSLSQAWRLDRRVALVMVRREEIKEAGCPKEEIERLLQYRATLSDLEALKRFSGEGFHGYLLRCLWIDQLAHNRKKPAEAELEWMTVFPPSLHAEWFVPHARKWVYILLRSGHQEIAVEFARNMGDQFIHVRGVKDLISEVDAYRRGLFRRSYMVLKYQARKTLQPIKQRLERLIR